ncbi:hypothetical protein NUW58_g9439 [Xylaria curta]|uniref:Uncharacterized protein n=1 Tax=Xylaria curta TaxID=42375 RepID=A0ACC1MYA2_9PEZI|nr:hypothetical protein NUW58_g9439 [Xylaria curta]
MGPWLARLLERLDLDSRDLAGLLLCLGQCTIPAALFELARLPSRTWGSDGELEDTPSSVALLIRNKERFSKALTDLIEVGFVTVTHEAITVRSPLRALLGTWGQSLPWKEEAVRLVSHSFPKHKIHNVRGYHSLCNKLLPIFRHAIMYLPEVIVSQSSAFQITEACLSASRFYDEAWKRDAIQIAQHAAQRSDSQILHARVALRQLVVERIYGSCKESPSHLPSPQGDRRSQAFFLEAACFRAQQYIDLGLLASAHDELSRCNAAVADPLSSFERQHQQEIMYMRAKVYRFEGQFTAARALLNDLIACGSHLVEKATIHLCAVECELGHVEPARTTLETSLQQAHLQGTNCQAMTRSRLELALANVQLMQILREVRDQRLYWTSHPSLRDTYLRCLADLPARSPGISTVLAHISIAAALAILAHLRGDFDTALAEWNHTLDLARGRGLLGSYIKRLVAYSTNDLLLRRGSAGMADPEDNIQTLSARIGRQYHFLGLGTTWPDILSGWQEGRVQGRLAAGTMV